MLNIKEFLPVSGIKLNDIFVDRFFHNLNNNMKIYITEADLDLSLIHI
jgi:hypothetical protein